MRFTTMPCAIGSASANSSESPALAKPVALRAALALLALLVMFTAEARAVMIQWSPVGDSGNASDSATGSLYGAVGYSYNIGTHDVTNSQYAEFLNAVGATDTFGLYNPSMGSDANGGITQSGISGSYSYSVNANYGNLPVNFVSWGDAARFTNWLSNGQPVGAQSALTTEDGSYFLNGAILSSQLTAVTRSLTATIVIPSENEWYKAAYYNPANSSYYQYPTSSNTMPTASGAPTSRPNSANFLPGGPGNLTDVGAYTGTTSPNGAFDMGGNVYQWNEALISGGSRGKRGGAFSTGSVALLSSSRSLNGPTAENAGLGFRVASISVPEPGTGVLALVACATLWWWRKHPNRTHRFAAFFCASFVLLPLTASAAPITVPTGLNPGDQYRLTFVTSTLRDATSPNIADYNAFVTTAANSVSALAALGTTWSAIGSTATIDARDNTATNWEVDPVGFPIYRLDGTLIASTNTDLWGASIRPPIDITEAGDPASDSPTQFVWTGTNSSGTRLNMSIFGLGLGDTTEFGVAYGTYVNQTDASPAQWIQLDANPDPSQALHLYAMSGILTVAAPEPSSAVLAGLAIVALFGFVWRRKRSA